MFDTYQAVTRENYVTKNVNVVEKRAPTDESVKLLREMETKAREQVIESVAVADTQFAGVLHTYEDYISDKSHVRCVFSMNGNKHVAEYSVNSFDATRESFANGIRDAIALEIANTVLVSLSKAVPMPAHLRK